MDLKEIKLTQRDISNQMLIMLEQSRELQVEDVSMRQNQASLRIMGEYAKCEKKSILVDRTYSR